MKRFPLVLILFVFIFCTESISGDRVFKNCNEVHFTTPFGRTWQSILDGPVYRSLSRYAFIDTSVSAFLPIDMCMIESNNCGVITPSQNSVFLADGAYNSVDGTLFFVDVPSMADGIFQFDPVTCTVVEGTYFSVNEGRSQRGIAFDPNRYQFWSGGPCDSKIIQCHASIPYIKIAEYFIGHTTAGAAIDPVNDYLFIGENYYPDRVIVYDISEGSLGYELGVFDVPWQTETDGYDLAGMAFDDDSGQLVIINLYPAGRCEALELFDFDLENGLSPAGFCRMGHTNLAWGLAIIEDEDPEPFTFTSYVTAVGDFEPPHRIDRYSSYP